MDGLKNAFIYFLFIFIQKYFLVAELIDAICINYFEMIAIAYFKKMKKKKKYLIQTMNFVL